MPCPVPDLKKKEKPKEYQSTWRKKYMIDLNTLKTKEDWIVKLDKITPQSYISLRQALRELKVIK